MTTYQKVLTSTVVGYILLLIISCACDWSSLATGLGNGSPYLVIAVLMELAKCGVQKL